MFAAFAVGQVLWSMIWFFLFFLWIMLVFQVFGDIFRSPELSGVAKVVWIIFVLVLPYVGVFAYLIVRGGKMHEHQAAALQAQQDAVTGYIRDAAGSSGPAAELAHLGELKQQGLLDEAEFAAAKAKILA